MFPAHFSASLSALCNLYGRVSLGGWRRPEVPHGEDRLGFDKQEVERPVAVPQNLCWIEKAAALFHAQVMRAVHSVENLITAARQCSRFRL